MAELWVDLPGYEGLYQVSNLGSVRRPDGKVLKGSLNSNGYRRHGLTSGGQVKWVSVHSMVMLAFVGPRPAGFAIDHINGDRTDNRLSNLRYCTAHENAANMIERGAQVTGERHGSAKLTFEQAVEIVLDRRRGMRCAVIARKHGIGRDRASYISRGVNWPEAYAHARSLPLTKEPSQ